MATLSKKPSKSRQKRNTISGTEIARYDFVLMGVVAILVGLGLVMIFSASFEEANRTWGKSTWYFLRQLQWLAVGGVAMVILALIDYRILHHFALLIMIVTLGVLIAVLLFGVDNLGARRHLIGTSVQPSEVAKLTITIYIAYWLSSKGDRIKKVSLGLLPFAILLGLVSLLIILQPDLGTTMVIVVTGLIMYFVAGADGKQVIATIVIATITMVLAVTQIGYAQNRVDEFLAAIKNPGGEGGYQVSAALEAFARGRWFGTGLGDGAKDVPLPFTDSIFAVVGEELGLVGTLLVVGLFMALAYRGLRIALRSQDRFGMVLGCGITGWLAIQAFFNMAVNTATLPFSGLTLPFISYGGSSLLACLAGVGLLLSISRYGTLAETSKKPARRDDSQTDAVNASAGIGRWDWWPRLSNFGRSGRPKKRAKGTARSRRAGATTSYVVKAASFGRAGKLGGRVTRTKRTIARRTGTSKRKRAANARAVKRIPRRR
ncbi:MAG: putative peptidoglycan glycosyltransferase FtsW [Chloroflexota bacterium]|nr:putative peptidoglycan glycosyltransferase FtsW [Chloroflexota bacterium]